LLKKALPYLMLIIAVSGMAQSRLRNFKQRELGFFAGASYYLGDLNPRLHFFNSRPAGGIYFRYSTNYRYAFRFSYNYGSISANDAASSEADQKERNLSFKSQIHELSSVAEFNFVEYRIGHDKHRFTLFIFAGLGAFYFNPKADIGRGYENLRTYKTEGQSKAYSRIQMNIPFGLGLKWNMGEKWGLGVEWGPRRTFTDYLDDVSGTYPDISDSNPYINRSLNGAVGPGSMRGNPSSKDWYFYYGITLNIKLRDPHPQCYQFGFRSL
jgi:hypothetical protein